MELEPVGGGRRDRGRRLRAWAAMLVPVLVLATVAAGGVLGQSRPMPRPSPGLAAAAPTRAAAAQPVTRPTTTVPPAPFPQTGAPLPARILGLEVEDVTDAHDGPRRSRPDQLVAIRGWLTVAPPDADCTEQWHLACRQTGTIRASTSPVGASLAIETQPGVPLPGLQRQDPRPGMSSVPNQAIVIGRFTRPLFRECGIQVPECTPLFTVERLAWIRRSARERPLAHGPGAAAATWRAETGELAALSALARGRAEVGETLLLASLDRATLETVDPLAAAATRDIDPAAAVWYVRAIVWRDGRPTVAWAVVEDGSSRSVAGGV